jgi:Tol biopolymer transport system component
MHGAPTQSLTTEGTLIGTLPYMAPEQLEGREADARSDIFAFGALVYEMVTGRRAFDGGSHASVIAAILSVDPPPVTDLQPLVPQALDRLIRKCLAKNPEERWQSVHDLKTALQWVGDAASSDALPAQTPPRGKWQERVVLTTAAVILLVSGIAIGFAWRMSHDNRPSDTKPIRFSVSAPEDAAFSSSASFMALSPDGRHLAFVATPSGSEPLLWIRSLDSLAARPLPGTTDASQPFWSPDSRFVAFTAAGNLKRVDIATGVVQTICDCDGLAGTWSSNGVILFTSFKSGWGSAIERVPAGGGQPTPVIRLDPLRGETRHDWPQFLPDGRHFSYVVKSAQPDFAGIYIASLDGSDRTRLLSDDSQALYVPPGYLVFRREGTVFAQRFDAATLKLSGDALPIVRDVASNFVTGRGVFSASNTGALAYRAVEDTVLTWFDRGGTALGPIGPPGHYRHPAISPDGRTVAIARLDPRVGTEDIWLISDHGAGAPFTFDPGWEYAPTWSPDGTRIVFASRRGGRSALYVKPLTNAASEELLLSLPSFPLDWSHDGRFVLFAQDGGISTLPLVGERKPFAVVQTKTINGLEGQLSPDGRWLAYDSDETGTFEVYVRPFHGTSDSKWQISSDGGIEPKWRRDGKELFYLSSNHRLMAVRIRVTPTFKADPPTALFETAALGTHLAIIGRNQYDIAPDGKRFLISAPARGSSKPITVVVNWPATLPVDARPKRP